MSLELLIIFSCTKTGKQLECNYISKTPSRSARLSSDLSATDSSKEIFCSMITIVRPDSLAWRKCWIIRSIFSCWTPSLGSSRTITRVGSSRTLTKDRIFRSPPDNVPASWCMRSVSFGKESSNSRECFLPMSTPVRDKLSATVRGSHTDRSCGA